MKNALNNLVWCLLMAGLGACGQSEAANLGDVESYGSQLRHYEGEWVGYVEAYDFNDGTDQVRVVLDADGHGVIRFGEAELIEAPTSIDEYAPINSTDPFDGSVFFPGLAATGAYAGFEYHFEATIVNESRLQFATWSGELMEPWCELFEPQVSSGRVFPEEDYQCTVLGAGYRQDEGGCYEIDSDEVDLGQVPCASLWCFDVCKCDAESCWVRGAREDDARYFGDDFDFDGAMFEQGTELEGTLVIGSERLNVRLTRN